MKIMAQPRPSVVYTIVLVGLVFFFAGFLFDLLYIVHLERNSNYSNNNQNNNNHMSLSFRSGHMQNEALSLLDSTSNIFSTSSNSKNANIQLDKISTVVILPYTSKTSVPPIVQSWRDGKIDWHDLIPKHNSRWERFGTPQSEGKLNLLVNKEIQITDYLTQFQESGLASMYGINHGKLSSYSGCDVFRSSCSIHDPSSCLQNEFCEWNENIKLCVERTTYTNQNLCKNPKKVLAERIVEVKDPSTCKLWIQEPTVLLSLDSEAQSMYYHFFASWTFIINYWTVKLEKQRRVHYIIQKINDPMFFQYFGVISEYCYRRISSQIPEETCFCNIEKVTAAQVRFNEQLAAKEVIDYLELNQHSPPVDRVKIGLISRRRKRFILNEYELVDNIRDLGYEVDLLPLESMTLYEQMKALRSIDVLIGIHGSALDNSLFLHPGSVLVQLLPYTVEHRVSFVTDAQTAGVKYLEWKLKDKTKAVFHWDLMDQANSEKLKHMTKEQILAAGQSASDNRETLMFWINQDIIIPIEEWIPLVQAAVQASPATLRGLS